MYRNSNVNVLDLKIPPKDSLYCQRCDSDCHKKCMRHLNDRLKWCSINQSIAKIDDFYISNVPLPSSIIKVFIANRIRNTFLLSSLSSSLLKTKALFDYGRE